MQSRAFPLARRGRNHARARAPLLASSGYTCSHRISCRRPIASFAVTANSTPFTSTPIPVQHDERFVHSRSRPPLPAHQLSPIIRIASFSTLEDEDEDYGYFDDDEIDWELLAAAASGDDEIDGPDIGEQKEETAATASSPVPTYDGYTVVMLKEVLRSRGLPVGGRKAELLDRLKDNDEQMQKKDSEIKGRGKDAEFNTDESDPANDSDAVGAVDASKDGPSASTPPENVDLSKIETRTTCVFDKANNYQLVTEQSMQDRPDDMLLSPTMMIPDEADSLLDLLPDHLRESPLLAPPQDNNNNNSNNSRRNLIEIILDLGRRPTCWIGHQRRFLLPTASERHPTMLLTTHTPDGSGEVATKANGDTSDGDTVATEDQSSDKPTPAPATTSTTATDPETPYIVTKRDLDHVLRNLHFGEDNRAGVDGHLHRISGVRNRDGALVGATLRVGRYVPGNAILIADLLYRTDSSILFVGPPGSAKTSILRDAARILSQDQSVIIVDTSCEIGGCGDIPHSCIGMSRRMQVKNIQSQARVMVECVQNHTPSVIVIDEIGRRAEVEAALTCKERGVRIMASAHGSLPGLVRNTELCDLVGGVDVVTIGDKSARQQMSKGGSGSKLKAERKGPPVFDAIVELKRGHLHEWQVVLQTQTAVDNILAYGKYHAQLRSRRPDGLDGSAIEIQNVVREANRDEIVDEQQHSDRSMSFMNNSFSAATQFNPKEVNWDYYMHRKDAHTCPVCGKKAKSQKGMKTHVLNTRCSSQVPGHVLEQFWNTHQKKK